MSPAEPVTAPECYREDPLQGSGGSLSGWVSPAQGGNTRALKGLLAEMGVVGARGGDREGRQEWEEVGSGARLWTIRSQRQTNTSQRHNRVLDQYCNIHADDVVLLFIIIVFINNT